MDRAAPYSSSVSGSKKTLSPGRMTSISPPRRWQRPTPSVTWMVCPRGWVCHAVRAPGVKWTLAAPRRDGSAGVATVSMYTAPVNHSLGPVAVSVVFLVICMSFCFSVGTAGGRRGLLQRQGKVEDLPGVDLPVPDQVDKLGQETPDWGGTAVQVHMREEELLPRDLHVVEHADEPDVTSCPRGADGLHHRLLRTDGLDDRVRAEPAGELLDPCRALLSALGHDLGSAELPGEPLAGLVAAHRDDPLRAELLGGEHREQPDGTVAHHRHRLAWTG